MVRVLDAGYGLLDAENGMLDSGHGLLDTDTPCTLLLQQNNAGNLDSRIRRHPVLEIGCKTAVRHNTALFLSTFNNIPQLCDRYFFAEIHLCKVPVIFLCFVVYTRRFAPRYLCKVPVILLSIVVYTRRFARRSASAARYARSQEIVEQNAYEADRDVHDFRCKLTTCKRQELHAPGQQPGRRMHIRKISNGRRERAVKYVSC